MHSCAGAAALRSAGLRQDMQAGMLMRCTPWEAVAVPMQHAAVQPADPASRHSSQKALGNARIMFHPAAQSCCRRYLEVPFTRMVDEPVHAQRLPSRPRRLHDR
jgi:hypothetical protein